MFERGNSAIRNNYSYLKPNEIQIYNAIFMCFIGPVRVVGRKAKLVSTLSIRYGDQQTANKMTTATSILTTFFFLLF